MRTLVAMRFPDCARELALALENLGEEWRADWTGDGRIAWEALQKGGAELLLTDGELVLPGGQPLLRALADLPPLPPPWVVCPESAQGPADASPAGESASQWMEAVRRLPERQALPGLCAPLLPGLASAARALLEELGLRRELRAAAFLPDMVAWCAAHPPMLQGVTGRLYPCFARQYGLRPGAVERDLRSALESLWSRGSLPAIDKWFGHTVDPEKGRPTNREFLALAAEHVRRLEQKKLHGCERL